MSRILKLYIYYFLGTPWTVNSEIYPLNLRGVGNSLSTFSNWVSNWALSAIFLTATEGSLG